MPVPELQGIHVLVTRPQAQADWLCREVEELGGIPIALPLLEIQAMTPDANALVQVPHADILIFVSANAVMAGLPHLTELPATLQIGAIGQATADQLRAAGVRVDLLPAQFDSEAFLALPAVQHLQGKCVVIVRGRGGRETLADHLRARGARVHYAEVYRRACPHWDAQAVTTALRADVISVTSSEALDNLAQLAHQPGAESLLHKPLVVFHARIAGRAHELGFTLKPVVTEQPCDKAMLAALRQWANEH
ncbi:MAG: uroporphyrinogen-III synthase [Gammaproteobacteria bacterium]|nr:uroporphyrinogen-III synthase [Gammaproteobacteria bacterium]